jgi:hypothetical protein
MLSVSFHRCCVRVGKPGKDRVFTERAFVALDSNLVEIA